MKSLVKQIAVVLGCLLLNTAHAQNGHSCENALALTSGSTTYTVSLDTSVMWFKWANTYNMATVGFYYDTTSSYKITKIEIYKGTCASYTLTQADSVGGLSGADTVISFELSPLDSNTQFIFKIYSNIPSSGGSINAKIVTYNYSSAITCPTGTGPSPLACDIACNGSLENGTCPTSTSQIHYASCWAANPISCFSNYVNTPDYYAKCAGAPVSVPQSNYCPYAGSRMGGVVCWSPVGNNYREYARNQLNSAMTAGVRYYVKFFVAADNRPTYIDALGAYITSTAPNVGCGFLNVTPHISNPAGSVIMGNCNANVAGTWTKIDGCYVASGGEQYITIGNFLPNSSVTTATSTCSYPTSGAYYFWDKLTVEPVDATAGNNQTIDCGQCATLGEGTCVDPDITYSWAPSTGLSSTTTLTTTACPTVTTTYTLTVTIPSSSGSGCSYTSTVTVTVNTPNTAVTSNPDPPVICSGQSATLTATGASTYSWTPSTGLSATTGSTVVATPTANTTYTVTGSIGPCNNQAVITVTVNPTPSFTVDSYTICNGSQTTVTVTGATSGVTYSWTPSTGLSATTGTSVVASPTTTTVYTVSGTNSFGCTGVATSTITVRPKPTLSASANPAVICTAVSTNTTALSSVTNGHAISWSAPASTTLSCTSCSNPTVTINGTGVFTFTVTATNTVTTCSNTTTVSVTVHPIPDVAVTSATICPGSVTTLTASGADTYTWSANAGSATTATVSVSPTSTTVYTVTGTDANGCTASATSTVTTLPVTTPVFSGTLCAGVAGTLTVSSGSGYTYTWSPSTGTNSVTPATGPTVTVNNPSGTYTVIATNTANSCTVSGTYATNPLPSISISTTPTNSYCAYSPTTVTLSASGASTYTWSANAGGGTASTATVMPSSTTSYTVTGTSSAGCQNTATTTITVVPTPTISVTASPTVICQGASSTLTASGANSYTWAPSGSLSSSTGATVTATPTATTTYTITGAVSTCTATGTITLNVNPSSTIAIAAAPFSSCNYTAPGTTTICAGASITFTATSGGALTSYTWTPGPITGSVVTVTPTVTTTYTVNGTGSGCPGSNTITVTVSNCPCAGTALPALTNTTITGGNYAVAPSTTVTVTGNVTLSGTDIKMGADAVILVPNGAVLRVSGSHLSSCYNMWKGIVVDPGGQLNVNSNSLIEDAKIAIDNNPTNTSQAGSPSVVLINGAVFNCNNTSVRRAFYNSGTTTNYTTSVFSVNDAVFTCRCNLPSPITTTALTIYSNTVTGTPSLAAPDLSDFFSVSNYTMANLRPPLAGLPPLDGVELQNVGVAQTTTLQTLPYINEIGGSTLVLFDNMKFGIHATNATFSVTNTAYQIDRTTGGKTKGSTISGGHAIHAESTVPDWYNGIYVDNSRFIHAIRGIHTINYYDIDIKDNILFSRTSKTTFGIVIFGPQPGDYGFYASSTRFKEANIDNNRIANVANGIVFSITATANWYNGGNGQYIGPITVNSNTLTAQFPGNNYTNKYIGTGIAISNVLTPSASNTTQPHGIVGAFIYARANTITDAYNGIYQGNHQWHKVRTEQNTVALQYHPTSSSEVNQYGIQHANCFYGSGASGYGNAIWENTVTGYFASTYTFNSSNQSTFEKKKGIWSRSCGNHYVTCNDVYHNGRGFEWEGVHTGSTTYWAQNTMNHNGEGHCLINNGTISTQSTSPNNANDNQWLSTANTYADTYVDLNSSAANGILWLQNTFLPLGPTNNQGGGTPYSPPLYLVSPYGACSYSCSVPPTSRVGQASGDSNAREGDQTDIDLSYLEDIVLDSIHYPSYQSQNSFINKLSVYQMLKRDNSLLFSSTLANFYTNNAGTSLGKFTQIEDSLFTGNLSYASTLFSSVVPTTTIESNYARFYQIYIAAMNGQLSQADSSDLYTLASSCPMLNGTVVFQTRALRNSILSSFYNYEDNCPQSSNVVQKSIGKESATQSLLVYPNPTTGVLNILNLNCVDKMVSVEITDIAGKIVATKQVRCNNGVGQINLDLNNGVYFIKAIGEDQAERSGKVIISK